MRQKNSRKLLAYLFLFPAQLLEAVQQLHLVLAQLSQQLRPDQLLGVLLEHGLAKMAAVVSVLVGGEEGGQLLLTRDHHVVLLLRAACNNNNNNM